MNAVHQTNDTLAFDLERIYSIELLMGQTTTVAHRHTIDMCVNRFGHCGRPVGCVVWHGVVGCSCFEQMARFCHFTPKQSPHALEMQRNLCQSTIVHIAYAASAQSIYHPTTTHGDLTCEEKRCGGAPFPGTKPTAGCCQNALPDRICVHYYTSER